MAFIHNVHAFSLDIKWFRNTLPLLLIRGDTANQLVVTITEQGSAVNLTGLHVWAVFYRSDGQRYVQTEHEDTDPIVVTAASGIVTIPLKNESFRDGDNRMQLIITDADETVALQTTATATLRVSNSILTDEAFISSTEYPLLMSLINALEDLDVTLTVIAPTATPSASVTLSNGAYHLALSLPRGASINSISPSGTNLVFGLDNGQSLTVSFAKKIVTGMIDDGAVYTINIADGAVSNAKLDNMDAKTIKGNKGNTEAAPADLTVSQVKTMLAMTGATSGAAGDGGTVPAPAAGDDTKFLSGDGTWKLVMGERGNQSIVFADIPTTPITMNELLKRLAAYYAEINAKLKKNFGAENAGSVLCVDGDGEVVPIPAPYLTNADIYSPEYLQNLVRFNMHSSIGVGEQFSFERETGLSVSVGDSTGITAATVDEDTFIAAVGEAHSGVYEATFDGSVWHKEDNETVVLADYGIAVTGTPVAGDKVIVTETANTIVLDVADHDKCIALGEKSLVFIADSVVAYRGKDVSDPKQCPLFSYPQLLIYAASALPAGDYWFTVDHGDYGNGTTHDGDYAFTTTVEIPAGGGIKHTTLGKSDAGAVTDGKIETYDKFDLANNHTRDELEKDLSVVDISNNNVIKGTYTYLGTVTSRDPQYAASVSGTTRVNFTERNAYGTNRYARSAVRQWLNSDGKAVKGADTTFSYWWSPQDYFDMPPDATDRKLAGFLHNVDPALVRVLGTASIVVEIPVPDQTGDNTETLQDKVFLASRTEIFNSYQTDPEGSQFALFVGSSDAAKLRYRIGSSSPVAWWTRSRATSNPTAFERQVGSSGTETGNTVNVSTALVPCMIIKA